MKYRILERNGKYRVERKLRWYKPWEPVKDVRRTILSTLEVTEFDNQPEAEAALAADRARRQPWRVLSVPTNEEIDAMAAAAALAGANQPKSPYDELKEAMYGSTVTMKGYGAGGAGVGSSSLTGSCPGPPPASNAANP